MKLGISSYCLYPNLHSQEMSVRQMLEWVKAQGADHVEFTPHGIDFETNPGAVEQIADATRKLGLEVANYAISANFLQSTPDEYRQELARVKKQVELAARLGSSQMRHDVVAWAYKQSSVGQFEGDFEHLVDACGIIADYAASYGITTTIENHGFYITPSDRSLRIVQAVNRPNFKMLLDIGNFLCVDENPVAAVKQCLSVASIIHFKDFYIRRAYEYPGEGWVQTMNGNYIRGAIFGQGDMDVRYIIRIIKESGYKGPISIEFEGFEAAERGTSASFANARRLWDEA
ncbi:sugar phosphate isomerase/epimerase [Paenibacillus albiflavus]|uniref:Sugar phosphate isomerase/epimerase n=2 Tax=Paenibacillus albiflavus TaxID=2545760 RepID=A0A4R4EDH1_9BACL|nr:sugar phosphate isomerase/epimerase [Paenibacillus albiflavus]